MCDRDQPLFNKKIKSLKYKKNPAFEKFHCDRNNSFIKRHLNILLDCIITLIKVSKYYPLHMKSFNHLMKDLKLGASS